jgi:hypothetical protein
MPGAALNDPELSAYLDQKIRRQQWMIWLWWLPFVLAFIWYLATESQTSAFLSGLFLFFFSPWLSLLALGKRNKQKMFQHVLSLYPWQTYPCVYRKKMSYPRHPKLSMMDNKRILLLDPRTNTPLGDHELVTDGLDLSITLDQDMSSVKFAGEPSIVGVFAPVTPKPRFPRTMYIGMRFDSKWARGKKFTRVVRPGMRYEDLLKPKDAHDSTLRHDALYSWDDRQADH